MDAIMATPVNNAQAERQGAIERWQAAGKEIAPSYATSLQEAIDSQRAPRR